MPQSNLTDGTQKPEQSRQQKRIQLKGPKIRHLKRLVFLAKLTVYLEKIWPRMWPFLVVSSLMLAAILFDLFPLLPLTLHLIVFTFFFFIALALFLKPLTKVKWTGQTEAVHRLETDSGFAERPLSALLDQPVHNPANKTAQSIWKAHLRKTVKLVPDIKLNWPVSYLGNRDKYSLRAGLIIILLLGFIEARKDFVERFERALTPIENIAVAKNWKVQAWITPPEHTGLNTHFITITADQPNIKEPLVVAQNSQLILRLEGIRQRQPVSVSFGSSSEKMNKLDGRSYSLDTEITAADTISIWQNQKQIAELPVILKPDLPPNIKLRAQPQKGIRGHLNVSYLADDDYGLSKVLLEIDAFEKDEHDTLKIEQQLSVTKKASVFRGNFAEHAWAGREVILTPVVRDNADQQSYGPGIKTTLPTRKFDHPLAQKLVTIRKNLFNPSASKIVETRLWVDKILDRPQDFDHNVAVYLPLRVASDRLNAESDNLELAQVRKILWESAVQLDEGNAGNARNQLEMLSQQMFDMMQMNAKSSEMEAMFEQMSQSLQQYMQQMAQNMPMMEGFENVVANSQDMQAIGQDEMQNLLDRARDMMRTGNMEGAQALLNQFQSILSRLAMQKPPNQQDAKMASEVMKQLQTIQQEQQKLLDQTFQRVRSSEGPSIEQTRQAAIEAQEQKMLANMLLEEMNRMRKLNPNLPQNLEQAQRAMGGAARFLETGLDESAIQAQTEALEKLIDGMQTSAQQMAQQLGMQSVSRQLPGSDPMGRGRGGSPMQNEDGFGLPSESEVNKSREVLQELYRRAGQKGRTQQELEYIERLLEPF